MTFLDIPVTIWSGFLLFVLGMLALDLGVFNRKAHVVGMKEALTWSAVWIGLALVFNLGLYAFWDRIQPNSAYTSAQAAQAFLAGYLVEKALSVDNIFVFVLIFSVFKVPAMLQHRVLFYGILGALLCRALFIGAGSALITQFKVTLLVFGGFLVFTGIKMVLHKDKKLDPTNNPLIRGLRRIMPVSESFDGSKFLTRLDGKLAATPLLVALLVVEFTDILFAVDSIPAIFAITQNPFIVFTSNVFAILGLRSLYFALAGLMDLFHYLAYGLAAILVWVGAKMVLSYFGIHVAIVVSLGVIIGILTLAVWASLRFPKPKAEPLPGSLAGETGALPVN